jgi:predicted ATPase
MAVKLLGHRLVGNLLLWLAKFDACLPHLEQVVVSYDPSMHSLIHVPNDLRVGSWTNIAWTLLFQGYPDTALLKSKRALTVAQEVAYPFTSAFGLHVNCVFHQIRGEHSVVEERSAALVALAAEQGFAHLVATGTFFHGWARTASGAVEAGIMEMQQGLAAKQATGAELKVPYYLGVLAMACIEAGQLAKAQELLAEALDRVEKTGERWFEAELHRCNGEVLLRLSESDQSHAEHRFRRAMAVAREQSAKFWELRAATSLARLWRDQGKRTEAHDLLAPVYGWFTEGFDTADLKDAKALLEELA